MSKSTKYNDEDIIKAVKNNLSRANALRDLGLVATGGNYKTIDQAIKRLKLDTSHFTGQGHLKGKNHNWAKKIPLDEILVENSTYRNNGNIKKRLFKENLLENRCQICGLSPTWQGKKLVLRLDHINGVNNDHRLENLRMLCSNCDSQTDTFAGRNIKKRSKKKEKKKVKTKKIRESCMICEQKVAKTNKSGLCLSCAQRKRVGRLNRPSKEILIEDVKNIGYSATGRKYGVSDNAIRKWLR